MVGSGQADPPSDLMAAVLGPAADSGHGASSSSAASTGARKQHVQEEVSAFAQSLGLGTGSAPSGGGGERMMTAAGTAQDDSPEEDDDYDDDDE